MADGTRLKELQEAQKKNELLLMDERAKRQASEEETYVRLDQMMESQEGLQAAVMNVEHSLVIVQQQLQSVVEQLQQYNRNKSILGERLTTSMGRGSSSSITTHQATRNEGATQTTIGHYNALNRMEFPHFDGENTRICVRKCTRYFQMIPILEDQKVVLERFEDLDSERVMTEFNKLHQDITINAYLERFEELKAQMLIFNRNLNEEFFTMKFISGLKEDIKGYVNTLNPTTLNQAIVLATKQEITVNAIVRKANQPHRNNPTKGVFARASEKRFLAFGSKKAFLKYLGYKLLLLKRLKKRF
ncbi:UNVERIFIED_CONTAM: hypothetical protein Slati_3011400 [Sesamum latifolium]|uniref:Ty3 transposon capsid-like protein domain-containing protein n=1 Tax=Sesamum latifolium TaxID=2727402 RepID=A0AAW2VKT2_9LAMI